MYVVSCNILSLSYKVWSGSFGCKQCMQFKHALSYQGIYTVDTMKMQYVQLLPPSPRDLCSKWSLILLARFQLPEVKRPGDKWLGKWCVQLVALGIAFKPIFPFKDFSILVLVASIDILCYIISWKVISKAENRLT